MGQLGGKVNAQDIYSFTTKSGPPANKGGQNFDKMPEFKMQELGGVLFTVILESLPASALEI